jgi:hypothetical protein
MKHLIILVGRALLLAPLAALHAADGAKPATTAGEKERHFTAKQVFDYQQAVIFRDDFQSGLFDKWNFSENDQYRISKENPERIKIVDALGLGTGRKAVRFTVTRAPNSFRSEISLPHESGFHERWYGERILVPKEWVFDPARAADIVMQWHAIPGNGKPTNPNLEISVANTSWHIRQTYGDPPANKKGWQKNLDDPVRPGEWVSWVIHAKWSPGDDGVIQVWKDGKLVVDRKGPNVYGTIGVEYTPYLKTGIYRPEWHLDKDGKREAFEKEKPVATNKVIYITDVKIGSEQAKYGDVAPAAEARSGRRVSSYGVVVTHDHERILKIAGEALKLEPISITQFRSPLSEGGPHDFFSMSDYFWPDPTKPDGKPYVQRDGQSYPGNFNEHRLAIMKLRDATAALAAAYRITQDERYAEKAVQLLWVFFVAPATRMNPNLEHAQVMIGKPAPTRGIGIIDTLHLIEVATAIRTLESSQALMPKKAEPLKQWFRDYLAWLRTSPRGADEGKRTNNHAVAFWLQIAAFSRLTGDETLLAECRRQFKEVFIPNQMAQDGGFPLELKRTKPYAYSIFQLDNMATLCQLLSTPNDNLWTFETADGRGMCKAMAYLYPFLADKSKWPMKPDVEAWEEWPVRQSSLLFAGVALEEEKYFDLWRRLKSDPTLFEIRRNNAITQPVLWLDQPTLPR